jgi:hypothetical protein
MCPAGFLPGMIVFLRLAMCNSSPATLMAALRSVHTAGAGDEHLAFIRAGAGDERSNLRTRNSKLYNSSVGF